MDEIAAPARNWPEYVMETLELAAFMVSALLVTILVEHPSSPVRHAIGSAFARRALIGAAMGVTAALIVYSPWGRRSGAHFNPSVTLTFLRLGRIGAVDASFYVLAQFAGAALGVAVVALAMRGPMMDPSINYIATVPGASGPGVAFAAELAISFGLMSTVLFLSNRPRLAPFTGLASASLVALYVTFEGPLSGMSMNPARSFAPALAAGALGPLWIYFVAPTLGMLLAAECYLRCFGLGAVRCAKLHHPMHGPCHFGCGR